MPTNKINELYINPYKSFILKVFISIFIFLLSSIFTFYLSDSVGGSDVYAAIYV